MDFGDYLFNDDDEKRLSSLLDSSGNEPVEDQAFESYLDPDHKDDRKPPAIGNNLDLTSINRADVGTLGEGNINDDFSLACHLQKAEDDESNTDHHGLGAITTGTMPLGSSENSGVCDYRLARKLQDEENEVSMLSSFAGQAWKFVEELFLLYRRHAIRSHGFSDLVAPIGRDDLVFVAERFFRTVEMFHSHGKPCHVDLGYHYTRSANLDRIRTDGLLSRHEREATNVISHFNGSRFGDGIYTAKNPFAYHGRYGDVGLVVARVLGCVGPADGSTCDSIQVHSGQRAEFSVLKTCGQCLPIFQFKSALVMPYFEDHPGNFQLFRLHEDLQALMDSIINKSPKDFRTNDFGQINPEIPASISNTWGEDPLMLARSAKERSLSSPMSVSIHEATRRSESYHLVSPSSIDRNRVVRVSDDPASQISCTKAVYPAEGYSGYNVPNHFRAEERPTTTSQTFGCKRPPDVHFIATTPKRPRPRIDIVDRKGIDTAALNVPKANSSEPLINSCDQKLRDNNLFHHVRECTFSKLSEKCAVCSVILMLKKNGKMVRLNRCGHCFHENCLMTSLRQSRYCPSCQAILDAPDLRGKS
jgi:Ring finger domain